MKILFITTDNFPFNGPTVNILNNLVFNGKLNCKVDSIGVLTRRQDFFTPSKEVIKGISIYRPFIPRYISTTSIIKNITKISLFHLISLAAIKIIKKIQDKISPNKFLRKDVINGLKKGLDSIFEEAKFDVIIPVFGNFDVVAVCLMKSFSSYGAKLVLYQLDPCSTNWCWQKNSHKKVKRFEQCMYEHADAIITQDLYYNEIKNRYTESILSKFKIIELPLIADRTNKSLPDNPKKKPICLFSGLIYSGIRDPDYTLELFSPLLRDGQVELRFAGVSKIELPKEFQNLPIQCYGVVDLKKALNLIDESDVLVNIGNIMTNQIPSKVFDYISTGKPIINVCKNRDCPSLNYLCNYPLALNLFEEKNMLQQQQEKLSKFIVDHINDRISFSEISKIYRKETPVYCADLFLSVLNSVLKKRN